MTVLHTGSTKKFSAGWDGIFSKGKSSSAKPKTAKKGAKKPTAKKAPAPARKKK